MYNWFLETFSTSSEQAKLFSIVVSVVLAVLILILNQWFISKRAKKELFVTKVEELLTTIYAYERISLDILSRLFNSTFSDQATLDKMAESAEIADKLEMLCVLYFPEITFGSDDGQRIILKAHHDAEKFQGNHAHPNSSYATYQSSAKNLKELLNPLKESTKAIMKKHT
ncbi:hypothetical protein [Enterovibrio norvegicus]|uniref:hypothetical protein n=1 Tax=Enterovibrio norvegicus TaxID=188144 RepID=UPI000C827323|nr:hypothetical protein [Enterovibrio norvegicus]PML78747.1 hypothetical protein BCT69_04785 [Enterovibrio norvegicus]